MKKSIMINGEIFTVGDIIYIEEMKGEPAYKERTGVVESIDDIGQLHGSWGSLAIAPEVDKFRKID